MALKELIRAKGPAGERQILVTEVTRMNGGMVCVAGIDLATGAMVRPLQPDGSNWEEKEWVDGGWLEVGGVVALRAAKPGASQPPHATEDFRTDQVTQLAHATPAQLYAACVETADADLATLFSGVLVDDKYVIDGAACRSLGCLLVDADRLSVSAPFDKVQVSWQDQRRHWHNLSVTEVAIRSAKLDVGVAIMRERIEGATGAVALRLGLARAWDGRDQGYDPKRCYLQLNGVIVPA